jgi:hypothetical protein
LLSFAKKCMIDWLNIIVQEDKTLSHAFKYQNLVFMNVDVLRLLWSSNSFDLNMIESCWFWMKRCRILLTDERMNCYCCLSKMNEKISLLYRKSLSFIYLLIFIFWFIEIHLRIEIFVCHEIFSFDQAIFVLRCYFDLISSKSYIHLWIHWFLDDFENQ